MRHLKEAFKATPIVGRHSVRILLRVRAIRKAAKLRTNVAKTPSIKLVVGASNHTPEGWLDSDVDILDITNKRDWEKFFRPDSIDAILAEHVFEHLSAEQSSLAMHNCSHFLKPGGYIRVAVPDRFHPDPAYLDRADPAGNHAETHGHQVFYDIESLSNLMKESGLNPEPLEWFDHNREFHFSDWSPDDGMIRRSSRFDERNAVSPLTYTSLLVDARKPKP